MLFEYHAEEVFTKELDLVDVGNSAVRCVTKDFAEYYILLTTIMGKTHVLKFGPVVPDLDTLSDNFSVSYKKIDYNEQKIKREIDQVLNDTKKAIEEAEEIPVEVAMMSFPNISAQYMNIGDDE